jgi:lysophospholipase L1-like esterase
MRRRRVLIAVGILSILVALAPWRVEAAAPGSSAGQKWVASWAASPHGPYPVGNPTAQPELKFAFPTAEGGANDQTFRLIVKPDLWGHQARLRFSNAFGTQPVTFDAVFVGMQASGGTLVHGTNRAVTFNHGSRVTVAPGGSAWSDPVALGFVKNPADPDLAGRKLGVSFQIVGASGPMTWHAKGLTTSYLTAAGAGAHGKDESDAAFPFTTTSWYFLDALDVMAPADTVVVAAFGDSITDGTASTLNGDDRWSDVFSRRLHAAYGTHVSVVNEGIGGNQVLGPTDYSATKPFAGGPPALARLDRDIFGLSGLSAIIFLDGTNDFGAANAAPEAVVAGVEQLVNRIRAHGGIKIMGATLASFLNSTNGSYGSAENDAKRKAFNAFIRGTTLFDAIVDFDAVTGDPQTGALRAQFQPNSTTGGPGDLLHPNRAGYQAMGNAIDLSLFAPALHKQTAAK